MSTPSETFRDELKDFQQRLPALTPENDDWMERLVHEVLVRWMDHTECESIWTTIRPLLRVAVTPVHFIDEVILRIDAEQLNTVVREAPVLEAKMRTRMKRLFSAKQYSRLAPLNAVLGDFNERKARVLGRKKTGPRINFMKELSAGFVKWCGQPLDNEVRVLAEIAFGGPTTTEAVRAARSPRARRHRVVRPQK